jgi:hypothetical protein
VRKRPRARRSLRGLSLRREQAYNEGSVEPQDKKPLPYVGEISHDFPIRCTDLPEPHRRDRCRRCPSVDGYLAQYIQRNGAIGIRWVCENCEDFGTGPDLPRSILGALDVRALPIRVDNRGQLDPRELRQCTVCESWELEIHFHHWAPRSIFPDWPYELGVDLCPRCHDEWHARMFGHGLRWPHEIRAAPLAAGAEVDSPALHRTSSADG